IAFVLVALIAGTALAQSAPSSEYGRAGGDEIVMLSKQPGTLSGSFGFSTSRSLGATLGGSLIPDRLWFFGAMQRDDNRRFSTPLALPQPSSSLSLHFTGIASSNSFFTAKVFSSGQTVRPSAPYGVFNLRTSP
ncbi:MAG TPA: hypothetical protein VG323_08120, partial [Thermoanaerobaculia bacterium]|nr:hypothetical protein [Thermoanaerobaculia bacterium]